MNADRSELRDRIRDFNNLVSITTIQGDKIPFPAARDELPWGEAMLIYAPVLSTPSSREPVRPYATGGAHFVAFTHSGQIHVLRDPESALLKRKQNEMSSQFARLALNLIAYAPSSEDDGLKHAITTTNDTMLWFTEAQMIVIPAIQSAIRSQIDRFTDDAIIGLVMHQGGIEHNKTRGFFPLVLMQPSTLYFATSHLIVENYYEYWRVYYEFMFDLPESQRGIYEFLTLPPPSQIERKTTGDRVVSHTKILPIDGARTVQRRTAVSYSTVRAVDLLFWGDGTYSVKFFEMTSQPIAKADGEALRDVLTSDEMVSEFELFPQALIPRKNSTFPGFVLEQYVKGAGVTTAKRPRTNGIIHR